MEEVANMSDSGTPFVLGLPDSLDVVETYSKIADCLHREVEKLSDKKDV
jgi:hypothetical protein